MEITLILATYLVSSVLIYSGGPWGVLEVVRNDKHIKAFGLFDCFLCVSFWVAIIACMASQRLDLLFVAWGVSYIVDKLIMAYITK